MEARFSRVCDHFWEHIDEVISLWLVGGKFVSGSANGSVSSWSAKTLLLVCQRHVILSRKLSVMGILANLLQPYTAALRFMI